jgi:hypothetical protein
MFKITGRKVMKKENYLKRRLTMTGRKIMEKISKGNHSV